MDTNLSLYFKAHLHQLYAEFKVFLYDTLTHVRKGSVKVDFTWRKFEENLKLLANKVLICLYIFP